MTSVNWEDVLTDVEMPAETFEPVPAGVYEVEVAKATLVTASSGNPMYNMVYKITTGEHKGKTVFGRQVVATSSPKSMGFLVQWLGFLGISAEYLKKNKPSWEAIAELVPGRNLKIKVGFGDGQYADRNEIKGNLAPAKENEAPKASGSSADPF